MNVFDYNYYIWGTGCKAEEINLGCKEEINSIKLLGYIDNNIEKQGKDFFGKKVFSPDILIGDLDSRIIILNKYYDEIVNQISMKYPQCIERIMEKDFFKRIQIITRYKDTSEDKIKEIKDYLLEHPLNIFNAEFVEKYKQDDIKVYFDKEKRLFYVYYFGKKMYISRAYKNEEEVKKYCNSVFLEQDINSPHRYLTDNFFVDKDSVVIDAGVAEGNFSLPIVEKVKKIYLFEPDKMWEEALHYTFEPYQDKVKIINKCLSDYVNRYTTTIDDIVEESEINFIKMDIEGEELYALRGAQKHILASKNLKCAVCTYHQEFAYDAIKDFFENLNFQAEASEGYMWFPSHYNDWRPPVLRKGLIRAEKRK